MQYSASYRYTVLKQDETVMDTSEIVDMLLKEVICRNIHEDIFKDFIAVNREIIMKYGLLENARQYHDMVLQLGLLGSLSIKDVLREWRLNRVTAADLHTLDWISDQWYELGTIKTIGKYSVDVPSDLPYAESELSRVLIENAILDGREYTVSGVPNMYSLLINKMYADDVMYLVTNLLKILDREYIVDKENETVPLDKVLDCTVQSPPDLDLGDITAGRTIQYSVYADRSDETADYSIGISVDIPFETDEYCYMIKHEPYRQRHVQEAVLMCAVSGKSTVLINTYDGNMYTIHNRMSESDVQSFNRLLRANLHLHRGGIPDSLDCNSDLLMVVDTEHNGDDIYEYAAVVYDTSKRIVVDSIVLTNSKARVNTNAIVDIPDGPDCHRFIVDTVGEDSAMVDSFKQFIDRYKTATLLHYGGAEGKDPLYEGMSKIDVMRLYSKVHDCSWNRQRFVFYRSYPNIKSILFHRALEDCISTLMIGLKLPLNE